VKTVSEMIKSDKKIRELSALLSQSNNLAISAGIELLRDEEPFEGAVGLLAAYYDNTEDPHVRKTIENFFNDMKDQSVTAELIREIKKELGHDTITMLISSCWQSGLNYSGYCSDLVNIFLISDYVIALECLTVIEESVASISRQMRNDIIGIIREFTGNRGPEKQRLTDELIAVLSRDQMLSD
jgi:hypothetical protein